MFYLDYHVSTQMCRLRDVFICVRSHTKNTYVYELLTCEDMLMRNI